MPRKSNSKPAERQAAPKTASHRMWLYKGAEARIFEEGEDIPAGWLDTPKG